MLTDYQQQVRLLMGDATFVKFNDFDFRTWINVARAQVAGQGACIRQIANLSLVAGTRAYTFQNLSGLASGVGATFHVRQLLYGIGNGYQLATSRPFEWFSLYAFNKVVPVSGPPKLWSQLGQGEGWSLYIDPIPDFAYPCILDVLGAPINLVDDTTVEAIPPLWTLAVPYYTAWLAYMSAQQQEQADKMLSRFQEQMLLARNAANPDLIIENWVHSGDQVMANRLGMQVKPPAG